MLLARIKRGISIKFLNVSCIFLLLLFSLFPLFFKWVLFLFGKSTVLVFLFLLSDGFTLSRKTLPQVKSRPKSIAILGIVFVAEKGISKKFYSWTLSCLSLSNAWGRPLSVWTGFRSMLSQHWFQMCFCGSSLRPWSSSKLPRESQWADKRATFHLPHCSEGGGGAWCPVLASSHQHLRSGVGGNSLGCVFFVVDWLKFCCSNFLSRTIFICCKEWAVSVCGFTMVPAFFWHGLSGD